MSLLRFLTDFADEAVLVPLAGGIGLAFLLLGWRRGAFCWLLTVGGVMAATLFLKLSGGACAPCWPGLVPRSPSGHVAAGTAVYGGLLALLCRRAGTLGTLAAPLAMAAAIAATRLALNHHTLPEVLVGALLGTAGAVTFARAAGPLPPPRRLWPVLALGLALITLLHGFRLPAEAAINRLGAEWWPVCRECR